jgi:hypothetical protein
MAVTRNGTALVQQVTAACKSSVLGRASGKSRAQLRATMIAT